MYRLFRDATKYEKGTHQKVLLEANLITLFLDESANFKKLLMPMLSSNFSFLFVL